MHGRDIRFHPDRNGEVAKSISNSGQQAQEKTADIQSGRQNMVIDEEYQNRATIKKLNHKQIELFKVKKLVGILYRLDLSTFIKIHNIFHLNLLKPMATNPLPSQHNSPPLLVVTNKE